MNKSIHELNADLMSNDPLARLFAINALAKTGAPGKEATLLKALTDSSPDVRSFAAKAMGNVTDGGDLAPLIKCLDDPHWHVRIHAADSFFRRRGFVPAYFLVSGLANGASDDKKLIRSTLARSGEPDAMRAGLESDNEYVRNVAAGSLGAAADPRAIDPLIKALGRETNADAAWTIGQSLLKFDEPLAPYALHQINENGKFDAILQPLLKKFSPAAKASLALAEKSPVCVRCLTRFITYAIKLGFMKKYRFFACRRCGLMGHRMENIKTSVAVIDTPWPAKSYREGDTLYINLHMHGFKNLFDFNLVEIRNAPEVDPDETIARLIQAVAHDDRMTLEDLKNIPVRVAPDAVIKQNTINAIGFKFKGIV